MSFFYYVRQLYICAMINFNTLQAILKQSGETPETIERLRILWQYHRDYRKSVGGTLLPEVEFALDTVIKETVKQHVSLSTFLILYPSDTKESDQHLDTV